MSPKMSQVVPGSGIGDLSTHKRRFLYVLDQLNCTKVAVESRIGIILWLLLLG